MSTLEIVRFLSDSACEAINRAEFSEVHLATALLDEAEELLALGSKVACRARKSINSTRKAA